MDKWTPEEMLAAHRAYRVTTSHMVPTQFHRLLSLPDAVREKYDVSSLRHMIHAAAPCPIDVKHAMIEWWGNVDRRVLRRVRGRAARWSPPRSG